MSVNPPTDVYGRPLRPVQPVAALGVNGIVQTDGTDGEVWVALPARPCTQVDFINNSGVDIEVRQDGAGIAIPIFDQVPYPYIGLSDAGQLAIRRIDKQALTVGVHFRVIS